MGTPIPSRLRTPAGDIPATTSRITTGSARSSMPINRYAPFTPIDLADRTWPDHGDHARRRCGAPSTCATATRP